MMPDLMLFANVHLAKVRVKSRGKPKHGMDVVKEENEEGGGENEEGGAHKEDEDEDLRIAIARMGYAALFNEVKKTAGLDFFKDPGSSDTDLTTFPFILNSIRDKRIRREAQKAFGQNVAYALDICAKQHRRFCFGISVAGNTARLMYYDRSAIVASRAFSLHKNPELLCDFLWRFSQLSEEQRGYGQICVREQCITSTYYLFPAPFATYPTHDPSHVGRLHDTGPTGPTR